MYWINSGLMILAIIMLILIAYRSSEDRGVIMPWIAMSACFLTLAILAMTGHDRSWFVSSRLSGTVEEVIIMLCGSGVGIGSAIYEYREQQHKQKMTNKC